MKIKLDLGFGFLSVLTLIFVIAKLMHVIDWNWSIVFLPMFIGAGIVVAFFIVLAIIVVIAVILK